MQKFPLVNDKHKQNEGLPPKRKKKKLSQNKPSRDESSMPRCNISSMAGSVAHGCSDVTM